MFSNVDHARVTFVNGKRAEPDNEDHVDDQRNLNAWLRDRGIKLFVDIDIVGEKTVFEFRAQ